MKWYCMSIFMYADDIVLLAPSISALQELLHICEAELVCLDMALNASKSMGIRIGPRHKHNCCEFVSDIAIFVLKRDVKLQLTNCCELSTLDGHKIQWSNETRYIYICIFNLL